jgi:hypothetical protein
MPDLEQPWLSKILEEARHQQEELPRWARSPVGGESDSSQGCSEQTSELECSSTPATRALERKVESNEAVARPPRTDT